MSSRSSPLEPPYDADHASPPGAGAPAALAGEFYCAPEPINRGVSLAAGQPGAFGDSDVYREPDSAVRGVSMAVGPHGGGGLDQAWKGGDFYGGTEDPHRGIAMPSAPLDYGGGDIYGSLQFAEPDEVMKGSPMGMGDFGLNMESLYQPGLGLQSTLVESRQSGIKAKYNILNQTQRFPAAQVPPPLPTDPLFALEVATTLILALSPKFEPAKIGNDLLDFLDVSVAAAILKVNLTKFTVKANVFIESRMCTIKARVYDRGGSKYALEMQRRSGDAVVFGATFQKATEYFDERLYFGSTRTIPAAVSAALAKPAVQPADTIELQPMLDMAAMEEPPSLQAEAATALAELVAFQPAAVSGQLCCQEAFDRIRRLLHSDKQEVAYPTARLLSQLAKMSEAGPFIADHSFVQLLVEKVSAKESLLLVRTEFTEVINTIVQQHADKLSSRAKDSISAALVKATGPGPSNSKLGPELQTSAMALVGGVGGGAVF
mmetsp:Transcript_5512/g.15112  ORF Transcript_5512/g.15112 Transcript_5512/m.15112 type:complete len:489 (+) Transcript_5512:189-1655(+)